jgi:hypothetical protein
MAAAADAALVLNRDGHGRTLYGRGRDINEFQFAVELKPDGQTLLIGDADEARRSQHQRAILKALREEKEPITAGEIAVAAHIKLPTVRVYLSRMVKAGDVKKAGRERYTV